jgi:hypothetical protein
VYLVFITLSSYWKAGEARQSTSLSRDATDQKVKARMMPADGTFAAAFALEGFDTPDPAAHPLG